MRIVGTGRSDVTNQGNNVIAFPSIFKGALNAELANVVAQAVKRYI